MPLGGRIGERDRLRDRTFAHTLRMLSARPPRRVVPWHGWRPAAIGGRAEPGPCGGYGVATLERLESPSPTHRPIERLRRDHVPHPLAVIAVPVALPGVF